MWMCLHHERWSSRSGFNRPGLAICENFPSTNLVFNLPSCPKLKTENISLTRSLSYTNIDFIHWRVNSQTPPMGTIMHTKPNPNNNCPPKLEMDIFGPNSHCNRNLPKNRWVCFFAYLVLCVLALSFLNCYLGGLNGWICMVFRFLFGCCSLL